MGDSFYSGNRGGYHRDWERGYLGGEMQFGNIGSLDAGLQPNRLHQEGLTDGNALLMPHRVALALQADGWTVRQVLNWFKKNCMPESVSGWAWKPHRIKGERSRADWNIRPKGWRAGQKTHDVIPEGNYRKADEDDDTIAEWIPCPGCDICSPNDGLVLRKGSWRHTSAVEYVFMLTKGEEYCADGEVMKEPSQTDPKENYPGRAHIIGRGIQAYPGNQQNSSGGYPMNGSGRNPRNFTLLAVEPYSGAHYATFPTSLILPLIQATCPKRCCPNCGQGWAPIVIKPDFTDQPKRNSCKSDGEMLSHGAGILTSAGQAWQNWRDENPNRIPGYRPTCSCGATDSIPGITLDPFCGSGTTGQVCNMLGLRFIGIDLSMPYLRDQAAVRVEHRAIDVKVHDLPLFAGVAKEVEISDAETTVLNSQEG